MMAKAARSFHYHYIVSTEEHLLSSKTFISSCEEQFALGIFCSVMLLLYFEVVAATEIFGSKHVFGCSVHPLLFLYRKEMNMHLSKNAIKFCYYTKTIAFYS